MPGVYRPRWAGSLPASRSRTHGAGARIHEQRLGIVVAGAVRVREAEVLERQRRRARAAPTDIIVWHAETGTLTITAVAPLSWEFDASLRSPKQEEMLVRAVGRATMAISTSPAPE